MKNINRQNFLKGCARGGVLAGLTGLSAVLTSRGKKISCPCMCERCSQQINGKCRLRLK